MKEKQQIKCNILFRPFLTSGKGLFIMMFLYVIIFKLIVVNIFLSLPISREKAFQVYSATCRIENIKRSEIIKKNRIRVKASSSLISSVGDDINVLFSNKFEDESLQGVDMEAYVVKSGDTIIGISDRFGITPEDFLRFNTFNKEFLIIGQVVNIPIFDGRLEVLKDNISLLWPKNGLISSPYGRRKHPVYDREDFHYGIDIVGKKGESIFAAEDGKVIFAGERSFAGITVVLEHDVNGKKEMKTVYAHMSAIAVDPDQMVKKGDVIGYIGKTGTATGYHLHFAVKIFDIYVNPRMYLRERRK